MEAPEWSAEPLLGYLWAGSFCQPPIQVEFTPWVVGESRIVHMESSSPASHSQTAGESAAWGRGIPLLVREAVPIRRSVMSQQAYFCLSNKLLGDY